VSTSKHKTETRTVEIDQLQTKRTQLRLRMDISAVRDYAVATKEGTKLPLPIVFQDVDSVLHLADGAHRIAAHKLLGKTSALVEIRQGSQADAILFAATCNDASGVRFTAADKRNAVVQVCRSNPKRSVRDLAKVCNVSYGLAQDVKKKIKIDADPLSPNRGESNGAPPKKLSPGERFHAGVARVAIQYSTLADSDKLSLSDAGVAAALALIGKLLASITTRFPGYLTSAADIARKAVTDDGPVAPEFVKARYKIDESRHFVELVTADGTVNAIEFPSRSKARDFRKAAELAIEAGEPIEPIELAYQPDGCIDVADEYIDADDAPATASKKKPKTPPRFELEKTQAGWYVNDLAGDVNESGPFKLKRLAVDRRNELVAEHA
jgi:hypothetical protein